MSLPVFSRLAALLAVTFTCALATAPSAQALEIKTSTININASVPILGTATNGLQSILSGLVGATTQSACELLNNETVCSLKILSYAVATDYVKPNNQHVVKVTGGVINLPTLVDATGDGLPDVNVLIQAITPAKIKMTITRLITAPATFPVSVEALVNDPSTPNRIINVGYDARATKAPQKWIANASLTTGTTTTVDATMEFEGAPSTMAVVGGLYTQGPGGVRLNPKQARLNYTPVPTSSAIAFSLAPDKKTARISSLQPTKADLELLLLDGETGKHVLGTLDKLAKEVNLLMDTVEGNPHTRLNTLKDISQAALTYEEIDAGDVVQRVRLRTSALPGQTDFTQTPAGFVADTSEPITAISGGVSKGVPVPADHPLERDEDSYVHHDTTDGVASTTFRLAGVQHAAVATTGTEESPEIAIGGRLTSKKVHVLVTKDTEPGGGKYDVDIDKVPHNFSTKVAFGSKRILDFCGSNTDVADPCSDAGQADPAGIDTITVHDSYSPEPLFGGATHINGVITEVPSTLGVDVETHLPEPGDENTKVHIDTTRAIGSTLLRANDGVTEPADPQDNGLVYVDTDGAYAVVAKVDGFRRAHFDTHPKLALDLRAAGGHDFTADVQMDDRTIHAELPGRPARTAVTLTAPGTEPTVLTVTGANHLGFPQTTPQLGFDLVQDDEIFARATTLEADVTAIPADLALTIATKSDAPENNRVHVIASDTIGKVLFKATDGSPAPTAPADNGLVYTDIDSLYNVVAKVDGFRHARLDTKPRPDSGLARLDLDLAAAGGHDFDFDVDLEGKHVEGEMADRPATTQVSLVTPEGSPAGLTIKGLNAFGDPVVTPKVVLGMVSQEPIFHEARTLHADVSDIPAELAMTIDTITDVAGNKKVHIDANDPIGSVVFRATDGSPAPTAPADNGLVYRAAPFAVVAKVDGFTRARLDTEPKIDIQLRAAGGHDFTYDVAIPGRTITGALPGRPANTHVTFDAPEDAPTVLTLTGSNAGFTPQVTPKLEFHLAGDEVLFGKATHIDADVTDIPASLEMTVDTQSDNPDNKKVDVATNEPIGHLLFKATDGGAPPAAPLDNGVVYQDQAGEPWAVVAKFDGLTRARLDTAPAVEVFLQAEGGHDLFYGVHLPAKDGKPQKDIYGEIKDRPARTKFTFKKPDDGPLSIGLLGFDAADIPTGAPLITAHAVNLAAPDSSDKVHNVHVELEDVPPSISVNKPVAEEGDLSLDVNTSGGDVGVASIRIDNGKVPDPNELEALPEGGGGANVVSDGERFYVNARVLALRGIQLDKVKTETTTLIDAHLEVGVEQPFLLHINQGIGETNKVNPGCDDKWDSEEHTGPHLETHKLVATPLQKETTFSYKSALKDGDKCKPYRLIEYEASGRADTIRYDTTAGDLAHLTAILGQHDGNPLKVPHKMSVCQAASAKCFELIGRSRDCWFDACDTWNAENSVYLETYGDKTRAQIDYCAINKDPKSISSCRQGEANKGIFTTLHALTHLDLGYNYNDGGSGFLTENTQRHDIVTDAPIGENVGVNGHVRYVNRFRFVKYINVHFGWDAESGLPRWEAPSTWFDNFFSTIVAAVPQAGQYGGSRNCVNPAYDAFFSNDNDTFAHVIAHDEPDDLGNNLTTAICGYP